MNDEESKITKRAISNMISAMIKYKDAPCSAEMHLMESIVDLAKILDITKFEDPEMDSEFQFYSKIINALRLNQTI